MVNKDKTQIKVIFTNKSRIGCKESSRYLFVFLESIKLWELLEIKMNKDTVTFCFDYMNDVTVSLEDFMKLKPHMESVGLL